MFLDVEMPKYSGLEIIDFLDVSKYKIQIVFVTAYSKYAVEAFKLSAIDYLLKPVKVSELKNAIAKTIQQINTNKLADKLDELKNILNKEKLNKIAVPFANGINFINTDEILILEADAMYTKITTIANTEILVSKPLKHFKDLLKYQKGFYNVHRSYIINVEFLQSYIKKDGGYVIMTNNKSVPIARDKKEAFLSTIMQLRS